jgi:hypothetical protein
MIGSDFGRSVPALRARDNALIGTSQFDIFSLDPAT